MRYPPRRNTVSTEKVIYIAVTSLIGIVLTHFLSSLNAYLLGAAIALYLIILWYLHARPAIKQINWQIIWQFPGSTALFFIILALSVDLLFADMGARTAQELADAPLNQVNIVRGIFLGIAGILIIRKLSTNIRVKILSFATPDRFFVLYAVIAILSASYARSFITAFGRACELFVLYFTATALISLISSKKDLSAIYLNRLWNFIVLYLILRLTVYLLSGLAQPQYAFIYLDALFPYQIAGWIYGGMHNNMLAMLGAILMIVALNRFFSSFARSQKIMWAGIALFALFIVMFAQARTSFFALLLTVPLLFILKGRFSVGALIAFTVTPFAIVFSSTLVAYLLREQTSSEFLTMSGRTDIWEAGWRLFLESPILGHGYYSGVRLNLTEFYQLYYTMHDLSNIDNTFLEVLVNNGILGFVPFMIGFVMTWWLLIRRFLFAASETEKNLAIEMIGVLMIISIRAFAGPTIQVFNLGAIFMIGILVFVGLPSVRPTGADGT